MPVQSSAAASERQRTACAYIGSCQLASYVCTRHAYALCYGTGTGAGFFFFACLGGCVY